MAKAQGISPVSPQAATIQRIWYAHGLQPHRTQSFKLSKDPRFTEKLTDVVGLYLNPPDTVANGGYRPVRGREEPNSAADADA